MMATRTLAAEKFSDAVVASILAIADTLACPLAVIDAVLRPGVNSRVFSMLRAAKDGRTSGWPELKAIWLNRAAREGLRILSTVGFHHAVLRRVTLVGDPSVLSRSCIFAIVHSPWDRVLAHWIHGSRRAVVFATGRWEARAHGAHLPCNWRGIRKLVHHLRTGGVAAVTVDHFVAEPSKFSTRASMLGRGVNASTGAARIAAAAGVPIIPVSTRFARGKVQIILGSAMMVSEETVASATRELIKVFDSEVSHDPSLWAGSHKFLASDFPGRRPAIA